MRYDSSTTATTTVSQITHSVNQCLGRLLQKRRLDEAARDDFAAVRSLLEALPLAADQFGLACTRLDNAHHYLRYTAPGAAWYELRLLASHLKHAEPDVREPQRRIRPRA
jgi:hypothetical protein